MATQTTAEAVAALTARTQQVLNAATAISAQGGDLNVAVTTANAKAVTATNKAAEALASQTSAAASAAAALASAAAAESAKASAASSAATASNAVTGAVMKSELAAVNGSDSLGFGLDDDSTFARSSRQKMAERKSLFDRIPQSEHAALRARTSSLNCAGGLALAIAACIASGGDTLHLPPGTFPYQPLPGGQDLGVTLQGAGRGRTIIKVIGNGTVFNRLSQSELRGLTIDLQGATYAGTACVFRVGSFGARDDAVEIKNANAASGLCIDFQTDGGSTFVSTGSTYHTLAAPGVRAAVAVTGTDTSATSRHFTDAESSGCTLYDFGGCNDFYVSGGFTNGLIFSAQTSKALLVNLRIGAAAGTVTVRGGACKLTNCVFAAPVVLEGSSHKFDCEVPSFDITDNSIGSQVEIKSRSYPAAWTSSGSAPSIGNGAYQSFFDRTGSRITVTIDFSIGSTTNVGTGAWAFSLPKMDSTALVQAGGSGFTQCGSGSNFQVACRASPGGQKVEFFFVNGAGALANLGGGSRSWVAGDNLRFTYSYICV